MSNDCHLAGTKGHIYAGADPGLFFTLVKFSGSELSGVPHFFGEYDLLENPHRPWCI